MDAHVLPQVVVTAEVLATPRIRAFVRFLVGVDAPYVSLQVFPSSEALAAARNFASVLPARAFFTRTVLGIRVSLDGDGANGRNTTTSRLLGEMRDRDWYGQRGGGASSTARRGHAVHRCRDL